jgi:GT2 family glycosyltransferase
MAITDILLPTCNRLASLVMTLGGVATQSAGDVRVIVADQSTHPVADDPVVQTLGRVIEERGGAVEWHHRPPRHGIAEQRDFLLRQATADTVLYLDDDVLMEPWVLERLLRILDHERCGFVGAFPAGLSHRHDRRPEQQKIDFWEGPVQSEVVAPESAEWERWQLHRAANLYHVAQSLPPGAWRR